ncbi:hypothetical protein CYMTET_43509 [Cymbomonas tetramitiformis]|uniref:Uncharacterized protein n=1 Tax=Cymbomonas tetramitiformis TaxID=36881 RepID=A0AAE0C3P9_9CHLO|nr:hypothetical protein CYMTET_43509 [Cymbomonas tetramitiformis]
MKECMNLTAFLAPCQPALKGKSIKIAKFSKGISPKSSKVPSSSANYSFGVSAARQSRKARQVTLRAEKEPSTVPADDDAVPAEPVTESATEKSTEVTVAEELQQLKEQQKKEADAGSYIEGVIEESKLIEWQPIPQVLGTTVLVISLVVFSGFALLATNSVLSELSTQVFG